MNWAAYGVIIIFGAFIILMILNPNLTCFGRKITSPLYPVLRHKKKSQNRIKTQDYGFKLSDDGKEITHQGQRIGEDEELFLDQFKNKKYKTKDYGFKLSDTDETQGKGKKEGDGESAL
jgi:hypothetical protein